MRARLIHAGASVLLIVAIMIGAAGSTATSRAQPLGQTGITANAGGPYHGKVNSAINFSGSASGGVPPYRFMWNFGDGATGEGAVMTHTYAASGSFTATLTVTDNSGSSATAQSDVLVSGGAATLQVSAGGPYTGRAGAPVSLSASASGATSPQFAWNFGDNSSGSGATTSHTYQSAGTYTVTLTVTDTTSGQTASATPVTATISGGSTSPAGPGAVSAGGPYSGVAGSPISFTAGGSSSLQYTWSFGDGASGMGQTTTHVYRSPGTYTVSLTVSDPASGTSLPGTSTMATISAAASLPTTNTSTSTGTTSGSVIYAQGWNLIAGPAGATFPQAIGPLYTLPQGQTPGSAQYQAVQPAAGVQPGAGYWAYFAQSTSLMLNGSSQPSASVSVSPGLPAMIGNPSATDTLTISGADLAISWDPVAGQYNIVHSLAPGMGAWVYVNAGGTVTIGP